MVNNISEYVRLEEERQDLIHRITRTDVPASKGTKRHLIRELRVIESRLGIKGDTYNTSEFGNK